MNYLVVDELNPSNSSKAGLGESVELRFLAALTRWLTNLVIIAAGVTTWILILDQLPPLPTALWPGSGSHIETIGFPREALLYIFDNLI